MTYTVSISQFRQNIAEYITKAKQGHTIILKDDKKDQEIVQVTGKKIFNPDEFEKAFTAAVGVFTINNHPEWRTKQNVIDWVYQTRKASDRSV